MKYYTFSALVFLAMGMILGCGADSKPGPTGSGQPSPTVELPAENHPPTAEAVPVEGDLPQSDAGLLDRATDLIRRATDSSSQGAETTQKWIAEKINDATESGSGIVGDASDWTNKMYKSLKDQGLTSAGNARQWLSEDLNNMSAFQYRIVKIPLTDLAAAEDQLNELGKQRWECFHAVEQDGETMLFFKKGRRSILKNIPVKDLMKLIPLMGNDEAE